MFSSLLQAGERIFFTSYSRIRWEVIFPAPVDVSSSTNGWTFISADDPKNHFYSRLYMANDLNPKEYWAVPGVNSNQPTRHYDPFEITDLVENGTIKDVRIYAKIDHFQFP